MAVKYDYDLVLFDIETCFLYGELEDEVYMEEEPACVDPDKPPATGSAASLLQVDVWTSPIKPRTTLRKCSRRP